MAVNVKTENVTDATIQVHISFERAARPGGYRSRRRKGGRNSARLRNHQKRRISTGKNRAEHQSSTKKRRYEQKLEAEEQKALSAPKPRSFS